MASQLQAPRAFGRGTLARTLVRRVAFMVAIIAIVLDVVGVFAFRVFWLASLDNNVTTALNSPAMSSVPSSATGPWASELDVLITNNVVVYAYAFNRDSNTKLTVPQLQAVLNIRTTNRTYTVSVPDLGPYRVQAQSTREGLRVVGVSMSSFAASFGQLLLAEMILTAAVVIGAALITSAVVSRTLRPVTALARAASRVATMRLDQGDVNIERLTGIDPASEVGQVGLAFNYMLDNVEDALRARHRSEAQVRAFVADASHELRNPLAAIRGYAELMGRDKQLPEQTAFAVDRINVESRRMTALVNEMLLLARLDQGAVTVRHPVDMTQLVVDAVADANVAGRTHHWTIDVPTHPIEVIGDDNQLHEVVANLLSNARKHTPAGTHVAVALSTRPASTSAASDQVVFTVTDDGPGIAPDMVPHIFERFVRADQARTHDDEGSTGLGLSIVASVIKAHAGTVSVSSVPGKTTFTVVLPAAPGDAKS